MVADNPQTTTIVVAIQSQFPAHLKYIGLSGQEYNWRTAGDIVYVYEEDVPVLLSKRIGRNSCCGVRSEGNFPFRLYKEAVNA